MIQRFLYKCKSDGAKFFYMLRYSNKKMLFGSQWAHHPPRWLLDPVRDRGVGKLVVGGWVRRGPTGVSTLSKMVNSIKEKYPTDC